MSLRGTMSPVTSVTNFKPEISPARDEIMLNRMCSASETCGPKKLPFGNSDGYALLHHRLNIRPSLTGLEG